MSFTSMHNDHLDPDLHDCQPEAPEAYQTVLDFFCAEILQKKSFEAFTCYNNSITY